MDLLFCFSNCNQLKVDYFNVRGIRIEIRKDTKGLKKILLMYNENISVNLFIISFESVIVKYHLPLDGKL